MARDRESKVLILAAIIAGASVVLAAIIGALFSSSTASEKGAHPRPFDYTPLLIILGCVIIVGIIAAGLFAAQAGIRKRERRRDLVERMIARDIASNDTYMFTEPASKVYIDILEQFARDVVGLSKTIARRSSDDLVTAKHIERAAEVLSEGSASRRGNLFGSFGGVVLGAGLTQLFVMLSAAKYNTLGVGLSFAACLVGVALLSYQWFST
jgi:hypothetical protein